MSHVFAFRSPTVFFDIGIGSTSRSLATCDVLGRSVETLCKQERVAAALRAAQASSFVEAIT